ncbi:MAG TPA: universal stress protein [Terriglobales bacterium]|nr:universal stress protein [Terriglobales bacterium]
MYSAGWLSQTPQGISIAQDDLFVRNILVATDLSQCSARALDYALGIAGRFESQLHLFYCIDPVPYNVVAPDALWKTVDDARSELEQVISDLRRQGRANSLDVKVVVEVGEVATVLPHVAKHLKADLTVVGTHGRTGWKKMLLGSVAETVIDEASCPVLAVASSAVRTRAEANGPESILLVRGATRRSHLAESYAYSLARRYRARLNIIDVLENQSGRVLAQVSEFTCCEADGSDTIPAKGSPRLEQVAEEVGTESSVTLRVANRTAADLVVLAVPQDPKFTDRFVSTDSYRVVCDAPCPVLTVRHR